ncbi:MAG: response regulator transcription factor [Campylobacterales bacterium]|nr:response regulator transcription factor [Campylobacterales bacterium]
MQQYIETKKLTKNLQVLYVEDEKDTLEDGQQFFNKIFETVDTALNGEEGLEKYLTLYKKNSYYYDIVICDIDMPKLNGVNLIKKIYEINKEQNIVVISAHSTSEYLLELVNMGIEQFLKKPYKMESLLSTFYDIGKKIEDSQPKEELPTELGHGYSWEKTAYVLKKNNQFIKLTKKESLLMELFIKNINQITSLEEIFNTLWSDEPHKVSIESLASHVSRMRKKVPELDIESIYGVGYSLKI